jgi:hypothetical protein
MFLRFTVGERDLRSKTWKGLFTAATELQDGLRLGSADGASLQTTLDWFNENLPVPPCYGQDKEPRAICCFTNTAGERLTKMWSLVMFLQSQGYLVQLHKTRDPGRRLYCDPYQVVAIPQGKPRVRTFRLR